MKYFIPLCLAVLATAYPYAEPNNHAFIQRRQLLPRSGGPPGQSPRGPNSPSPKSSSGRQSPDSMDSGPRYTAPSKLSYGRYPNTDSDSDGAKSPKLPKIPETYAEAASKGGISSQKLATLVPDPSAATQQYGKQRQQREQQPSSSRPSKESSVTGLDSSDQLHRPFSKLSLNEQHQQRPQTQPSSSTTTTTPIDDSHPTDSRGRTLHEKALQAAMLRRLRQTGMSAAPSGFMGSIPSGFESGRSSRSPSPSSSSSGLRTSSTVSRASSPPGSVVLSRAQSPIGERSGQMQQMQMPPAAGSSFSSSVTTSTSASSSRFKPGRGNRSPPRRG